MTKRQYNFGHTYQIRQLRLQRRKDYKVTEYYRHRLNQLLKRPLSLDNVKQTLERAGIH